MLCPPLIQSIAFPARATPRLKTHPRVDESASWSRGSRPADASFLFYVDYVVHSARSFRGEILDARGKGTDAIDPRDHERVTCDNDDFTCVSILALLVVSLFSETSRRRRAF